MPRTVLEIVQNAALKIGVEVPDVLFASTDRTVLELRNVLQEVAERIVRAHDWSILKKRAEFAGDGTATAFDMPSDYLRMPKDSEVWSSRWQHPLAAVCVEDVQRLDVREYDLIEGVWTLLAGQMVFRPALEATEVASFYYVADLGAQSAGGVNKARFTDDDDTFRLGDRLLELHLVWEWRNRKGLDYAEDLQTAEIELARAISDDKGARIVSQRSRRVPAGVSVAYPWRLG